MNDNLVSICLSYSCPVKKIIELSYFKKLSVISSKKGRRPAILAPSEASWRAQLGVLDILKN
jgi:hypothetical protein